MSAGTVATPFQVIERSGDRSRDHQAVASLLREVEADVVVVGLPRSLHGGDGPAAAAVRDEAADLAAAVDVPVVLHDERFTTVTAEQALRRQGLKGPARRRVVDQVAAAVILQSWIDSGCPGTDGRSGGSA